MPSNSSAPGSAASKPAPQAAKDTPIAPTTPAKSRSARPASAQVHRQGNTDDASSAAAHAAADAAAQLLLEEEETAQAARRSKQKGAAKKARQKQRKQVRWQL